MNNNPNKSVLDPLPNNFSLINAVILLIESFDIMGKNRFNIGNIFKILFKPKSLFSRLSEFLKQLYPNSIINSGRNLHN